MKNLKAKKVLSYFIILLFIITSFHFNSYSTEIVDKKGRIIEEILKPHAKENIDLDTISDVDRIKVSDNAYMNNSGYAGPSKNIYSSDTVYQSDENNYDEIIKSLYSSHELEIIEKYGSFTKIRHTSSITNVDEDRYELIEDYNNNRLRMKIFVSSIGIYIAKDGFYKVNDKIYYFDNEGLMVLGPAFDNIGNYYFFSYETGELLEEIEKKN